MGGILHLPQGGGENTSCVISKTTAEWNAQPGLVSKLNIIYVYTDYEFDENNQPIPAMKIGDGNRYVIDLPFLKYDSVTIAEKVAWNNKVTVFLDANNEEIMVFSKNADLT